MVSASVTICDQCPEPAIAIAPGTEEIRELFLLSRGVAMRCWCRDHWLAAFGRVVQERPA